MGNIVIYSDGACDGNPGPGGWGAVLFQDGRSSELNGGAKQTTNNRMELQAAIETLRSITKISEIDFYTDSKYLRNGITGWIANWKRNGWRTSKKSAVKNADLWRELDELTQRHQISWHWSKGHAGNEGNERAHRLATAGMSTFLRPGKAVHRPLANDRLIETPVSGGKQGIISARIIAILSTYVSEKNLGYVLASKTGFLIGDPPGSVLAPDVAFISRGRLEENEPTDGLVTTVPDLVVEVVSSSDQHDRVERLAEQWTDAGASVVWIVDPVANSVIVWRGPDQVRFTLGDDEVKAEPALPTFRATVSDLLGR